MQNRVTYEFAVIKVVPKVERGEYLNVGVILFSKSKKFLGMKYKMDDKRLKAFSGELDVDSLHKYLNAWELICKGEPEGGSIGQLDLPSRFRWLTAARSTIIQSSETHPGICHEPEKVLETLFERFVL
jgi:hypothetical protein